MKLSIQQALTVFFTILAGLITGIALFWVFRMPYYRDLDARLFPDTTPIMQAPEIFKF
jgi:hypothetical protein